MFNTSPSKAGGGGSIPGQEAKMQHGPQPKKTKHRKQKQYRNKFKKDFKKIVCFLTSLAFFKKIKLNKKSLMHEIN